MKIRKLDLEDILYGACFLASGGGGPLSLGESLIKAANLTQTDSVELVDYSNINENSWIVPTSGMGLPSGSFEPENLNSSITNVINIMENWCNHNIDDFNGFEYVFPMEVGTVNSILALVATIILNKNQKRNIKVINGDPSGRATPTLPLTLFAGHNSDIFPNFIANGSAEPLYGSFNVKDIDFLQDCFSQMFTSKEFANSGGFSLYPKVKNPQSKALVLDTYTFDSKFIVEATMEDALYLGKIIRQDISAKERVNKIVEYMNTKSKENRKTKAVFTGVLTNIDSVVSNGTDVGRFIIEGEDEYKGKQLRIATENENIFANIFDSSSNEDGETYITGPDSICLIPEVEGLPTNEIKIFDVTALEDLFNCPLKKVIRLHVIAIKASQKVRACQNLIDTWTNLSKQLGGHGDYNVNKESLWEKSDI